MSEEEQGFSRLTKLVLTLLALLPVWYLLHQYWNDAARSSDEPIAFSDALFRIMVGVVGFLALILLIHGGKRPGRSGKESHWAGCPCCGHRVRCRSNEMGKKVVCPACDSEFETSPLTAASAPVSGEDVEDWSQRLSEQRRGRKNHR